MGERAAGFFREALAVELSAHSELSSIADQHRQFVDHCHRGGYDVIATFVEGRETEAEPPAFTALLDLVQRDPPGLRVILSHPVVLGASPQTALRRLYELLAAGATVEVSGAPPQDLLDGLLATTERSGEPAPLLGDRVREAMRRKAVKGEVLGRSPFGYRAGSRHRLEPVPDEAVVVQHIFRWYVHEGLGIRLIARRLNEDGYRTRRGGAWSMVTIRDILRNRVYLGTYARFGVRVPGSHAALVSGDEFRKAQERMATRRTSGGPRSVSPFLLSGLAVCGACGGHMIGVSRRQRWTRRSDGGVSTAEYRYYQCGSRTNQSVCAYHTHRADDLDETVRTAVQVALEAEPAGETLATLAAGEPAEVLRQRLLAADREIDRLIQRLVSRPPERSRLHPRILSAVQTRDQIQRALAEREEHSQREAASRARAATRQAAVQALGDGWAHLAHAARRELLESVLARATVYDDHVLVTLAV